MLFLGDLKPFYYGARMMGCYSGLILEYELLLMTWGIVYSLIWAVLYICMLVYDVHSLFDNGSFGLGHKLFLLSTLRSSFYYVCIFADNVLTVIYNGKLNAALQQLRKFDRATKLKKIPASNFIKRNKRLFVVLVIFSYCIAVPYLAYRIEHEGAKVLYNSVINAIVYSSLSMQVMKFRGLMLLLHQRFRHLDEMVFQKEGAPTTSEDKKSSPKSVCNVVQRDRVPDIQDIWWLHWCLTNATKMIGSVYSTQMLLWIAVLSFDILSRINAIMDDRDTPIMLNIVESFIVIASCVNLICIISCCHFTSMKVIPQALFPKAIMLCIPLTHVPRQLKRLCRLVVIIVCSQANQVGKSLFSPVSQFSKKRHTFEEQNVIATYFQLQQLQFSAAAGLIRVDLNLLLSIAGAITTYLVILHKNHP